MTIHNQLDRLLCWAQSLFGQYERAAGVSHGTSALTSPPANLEEMYAVAANGCKLEQLRSSSPEKLYATKERNTDVVLDTWGRYAGQADPFVCFGADDRFWTRPKSAVSRILFVHAQIVPSPMRFLVGKRMPDGTRAPNRQGKSVVSSFDPRPLVAAYGPPLYTKRKDRIGALNEKFWAEILGGNSGRPSTLLLMRSSSKTGKTSFTSSTRKSISRRVNI